MGPNALRAQAMLIVLAPLLLVVCVTDLRSRRIPNAAVVAIALTGIAASLAMAAWPGALTSIESTILGLALWLPFYGFRMLGAGDVKLFAAAAAWLGPRETLNAALLTAFVGGALSLAIMIKDSGAVVALFRLRMAIQAPATLREASPPRTRVPYAVAIAAGVAGAALLPGII